MSLSPTNHRRPPDVAEQKSGLTGPPQPGITPGGGKWADRPQEPKHPATPDTDAPDGLTDEQLIESYRLGNKTGFSQLVERYQRELFHFLVRFLGDRSAAEDVFQETFLQVHQSASQFDSQRRFRPWLFTIAANKARDLMRSQARRPTNPLQASISPGDEESGQFIDLMRSLAAGPGENLEKEELQRIVQATVMGMPEHLREILLLSYFHQFPYKQIGDILSIPLGTVKSRLHAAVAHFADRWRALQENKPQGQ
ncbi:MAG: RNA polymerase sigma factor [Planctomycetota bacterium]|nr:RNA polymerase sigma factor [Planctomycetota bacterium]